MQRAYRAVARPLHVPADHTACSICRPHPERSGFPAALAVRTRGSAGDRRPRRKLQNDVSNSQFDVSATTPSPRPLKTRQAEEGPAAGVAFRRKVLCRHGLQSPKPSAPSPSRWHEEWHSLCDGMVTVHDVYPSTKEDVL